VAMFIPVIKDWCRANNLSPGKFLIPLSYATFVGGACTIIGSSTNLVAIGIMQGAGIRPFHFIELGYVAIPCAALTVLYLITIGASLLPDDKGGLFRLARELGTNFMTEMVIPANSKVIGITVKEAVPKIIEGVEGVELLQVIQQRILSDDESEEEVENQHVFPVPDNFVLSAGDHMTFIGSSEALLKFHTTVSNSKAVMLNNFFNMEELLRQPETVERKMSLNSVSESTTLLGKMFPFTKKKKVLRYISKPEFFEVVISSESEMIGENFSKIEFEQKYKANVIALRRRGSDQLGLQTDYLNEGDTLLLLSSADFYDRWITSSDFFVISRCNVEPNFNKKSASVTIQGKTISMWWWKYLIYPIFIGVIAAAIAGIPMLHSTLIGVVCVVMLNLVTPAQALNCIDWGLVVLIGASFALGKAVQNSGLAALFASLMFTGSIPTYLLPGIMFLLTTILTSMIANNAAVALFLPFAFSLAEAYQVNAMPLCVTVTVASAVTFMTTIGYQTNLMVMGPGGYSNWDFLKVGTPITILYIVLASVLIPVIWPL
jgi:di/tricarboxylate transporter